MTVFCNVFRLLDFVMRGWSYNVLYVYRRTTNDNDDDDDDDKHTHPHTNTRRPPVANTQTGPITIQCATKLNAQCNEKSARSDANTAC